MDQFYTDAEVARDCLDELRNILPDLGLNSDITFIEPSAGDGVFYELLPAGHRIGFDIEPRHPEIIRRDYLTERSVPRVFSADSTVVVGNPPFGKRGRLAVQFFTRAAEEACTIGFIVPVIFRKYFIHRQLPEGFRWIHRARLRRPAFRTPDGRPYDVNAEFQVWTRIPSRHADMRLHTPPPIRHRDFLLWQYNNTREALKVFGNDFDFAVPCQGWQDYSRRPASPDECEKHKQWMLLKARNQTVLRRLREQIDYGALAIENTTTTPGFRKGDLVAEYTALFGPGD